MTYANICVTHCHMTSGDIIWCHMTHLYDFGRIYKGSRGPGSVLENATQKHKMSSCDVIWHHMMSNDIIWWFGWFCLHNVWNAMECRIIWHHMTSYDIIWWVLQRYSHHSELKYKYIWKTPYFSFFHVLCIIWRHMTSYDVIWCITIDKF